MLTRVEERPFFEVSDEPFPTGARDSVGILYTGLLRIEEGGNYIFTLNSDDGTKLFINDTLVIDNDGLHAFSDTATGPIFLPEGDHSIRLEYFEAASFQGLSLKYQGADTNGLNVLIGADAFSRASFLRFDGQSALFSIRSTEGGEVPINVVSGGSEINSKVELFTARGAVLASADEAGPGDSERLTFNLNAN